MEKATKISPFRLTSLLGAEQNPNLALYLFQNPNPNSQTPTKYRYTAKSYDLIICKLGRARRFAEMEHILEQMSQESRFTPKEALFCHVISFYGRAHMPHSALRTFHRIPTPFRSIRSFNSLLNALLNCGELAEIAGLCGNLELLPDACTYNILIRASTCLDHAFDLFDEMCRRGIKPTVVTFGTLIFALCNNLKIDEALKLKYEMVRLYDVKPNVFIYTTLIKALCASGKLDEAIGLKKEVVGIDSAVYSTLISALFKAGRKGEVVGMLEEMKGSGVKPDVVTYNSMIGGFCDEKDFDAVFEVLGEMERAGTKADVVTYNTIILGFCKVGRIGDAVELFEDMPRRGCKPDVVCYRMIFEGLCDAKQFIDASLVYDEMVFKGFGAREGCVRKFLEGLCEKEDWSKVVEILCRLSKGNGETVLDGWTMAVSRILKESEFYKSIVFIDHMRFG